MKDRSFGFSCFDFRKADFIRMNSYLENVSWETIFEDNPINFGSAFESILLQICHLTVPIKSSFLNPNVKRQKIFSISALKRKQKKVRVKVRALQALNPSSHSLSHLKNTLKNIDNKIKQKLVADREESEAKAISAIKSNPKILLLLCKKIV